MEAAGLKQMFTDAFLECPICLETLSDPRILDCLHTFCLECLRQHASSEDYDVYAAVTFDCPACKQQMLLPPSGVDGLKKHFFINKLQDFISLGNKSDGSPGTCDLAQALPEVFHGSAQYLCVSCNDRLCEQCKNAHKGTKLTRDHDMRKLGENVPEPAPVNKEMGNSVTEEDFCTNHTTVCAEFLCETCNVLVCAGCLSKHHRNHDCISREDVEKAVLGKLDETRCQVKAKLSSLLKEQRTLTDDYGNTCSKLSEAKNDLTKQADFWIAQITQKRDNFLSQVSVYESEAEAIFMQNDSSIGKNISDLLNFDKLCLDLQSASAFQRYLARETITSRLRLVNDFVFRQPLMECSRVPAVALTLPEVSLGSCTKINTMDEFCCSFLFSLKPGGGCVVGIDQSDEDSGELFVSLSGEKFYRFNRKQWPTKSKDYSIPGSRIQGMCRTNTGSLLISCSKSNRCFTFSLEDFNYSVVDSLDTLYCPKRLVRSGTTLLLSDFNYNQPHGRVCVMLDDEWRAIDIEKRHCVFACLHMRAILAVCYDNGKKALCRFSLKSGKFLRAVEFPSSFRDQVSPSCVATTADEYVFVADDVGHRIHLLRPDLGYVKAMLGPEDRLKKPSCLYWSEVDRILYVGQEDGTVHAFHVLRENAITCVDVEVADYI